MVYSTTAAPAIIAAYAAHYGISAVPLEATLKCESQFKADAAGDFSSSTMQYTSFGVAQIHLSAHPEVTKEEALDPLWSINWAAEQFAEGNANLWTCYTEFRVK